MRRNIAALAIGMGLMLAPAHGEDPSDQESAELRREVTELKAILQRANERLKAIETRLNGTVRIHNLEAPSGKLRFPINIERAMMGDALRPWEGRPKVQRLPQKRTPSIEPERR